MKNRYVLIGLAFALGAMGVFAQEAPVRFREISRFQIPEARQGVAVDERFFYAVNDREIARYEKKTGEPAGKWVGKEGGPVIHLDSGVIVDGKLVCAHSNYSGVPMTSSVEIWDPETMTHIGSHSFGIHWGSCTWIDRFDGYWWGAFAHYNKLADRTHTDNTYTTLVKFDDRWQMLEAWVYPQEIIERFDGMSNSGGSWGSDGRLYLTGHDRSELYAVRLPRAGSVLVLEEIIPVDNRGQGIAWDRTQKGVIYTIRKKEREVVVFQLVE
jgi:hypothetical protein